MKKKKKAKTPTPANEAAPNEPGPHGRWAKEHILTLNGGCCRSRGEKGAKETERTGLKVE